MNFKRHLILLATSVLIGGLAIPAQAQNDNEEKSITVTDDEGKQEEINLPQSMTMELDSPHAAIQCQDVSAPRLYLQHA